MRANKVIQKKKLHFSNKFTTFTTVIAYYCHSIGSMSLKTTDCKEGTDSISRCTVQVPSVPSSAISSQPPLIGFLWSSGQATEITMGKRNS